MAEPPLDRQTRSRSAFRVPVRAKSRPGCRRWEPGLVAGAEPREVAATGPAAGFGDDGALHEQSARVGPAPGRRGRPRAYSDVAIETGHLLRPASVRPWRQTECLLRSLVGPLGWKVGIPDHATFAPRSPGLALAMALARAQAGGGPVHVVIDATG